MNVLKNDEKLLFILKEIGQNDGLYIEKIKSLNYEDGTLNQHIAQRSLEVLKHLGLVEVKKEIGRTKIYGITSLAKATIKQYRESV